MAEIVKIGNGGCASCKETPPVESVVECRGCKSKFHVVCDAAGNDNQQGSKTMVKTFNAASTKTNFMWFCNICLTNYEKAMVEKKLCFNYDLLCC